MFVFLSMFVQTGWVGVRGFVLVFGGPLVFLLPYVGCWSGCVSLWGLIVWSLWGGFKVCVFG